MNLSKKIAETACVMVANRSNQELSEAIQATSLASDVPIQEVISLANAMFNVAHSHPDTPEEVKEAIWHHKKLLEFYCYLIDTPAEHHLPDPFATDVSVELINGGCSHE